MTTPSGKHISDSIRAARVEALKRAVQEGRYHIDAAAIADRLLDDARRMIGARMSKH